jgi:hypothetical protein
MQRSDLAGWAILPTRLLVGYGFNLLTRDNWGRSIRSIPSRSSARSEHHV